MQLEQLSDEKLELFRGMLWKKEAECTVIANTFAPTSKWSHRRLNNLIRRDNIQRKAKLIDSTMIARAQLRRILAKQ